MNVLLIAKPLDDPATRYRMLPLQQELENTGHKVQYWHDHRRSLSLARRAVWADLIVLQRRLLTWPLLGWIRHNASQLVFDFDDAIFLRSNGLDSLIRRRRFRQVVRWADQVWCGNRYLAEQAKKAGAEQVHWVPTSVSVDRYDTAVAKADRPTMVWIGSSSTRRYLENHRQALEQIGLQYPQLQLRVVADFEFRLQHLHVENRKWSAEEEVACIKSAHMGIAPMPDNPWSRGKCGLKVIQYMAAGLPVVSSPVGAHLDIVQQDATGFLAATTQDWFDAVSKLLDDPCKAAEMGVRGRASVAARFSQEKTVARQLNLLKPV